MNFQTGAFSQTTNVNSISIVGKRFIEDNKAMRYIASFNFGVEKTKDVDATSNFGLTVGLGKEWRKGITRLQGYYGADVLVGFVAPAKKQFGFGVGAQAFGGVEYFIFPKVALGAQYTYGVALIYTSDGNKETNTFGFNIGSKQGLGIVSATLNAYF